MSTLEIIEMIVIGIIIVILSIYYLIKAIKNKWLSKIYKAIKDGVVEAEKSRLKGAEKKAYVIKYVQLICDEEGIPYSAIKKLIDKAIETIVDGYNTIAKSK